MISTQNLENIPDELLIQNRFIPIAIKEKRPLIQDWNNEEKWIGCDELTRTDCNYAFVTTGTDYCVLDWDNVLEDGKFVDPYAEKIYHRIVNYLEGDLYIETSQSGTGIHMICKLDKEKFPPMNASNGSVYKFKDNAKLELWFNTGHNFTFTGHVTPESRPHAEVVFGDKIEFVVNWLHNKALDQTAEIKKRRMLERGIQVNKPRRRINYSASEREILEQTVAECLEYIPVADLPYSEWISVGMILKHEGFSCTVWDSWSANDDRYKPYGLNSCAAKWRSFDTHSGKSLGVGTLVNMAKQYGYIPQKRTDVKASSMSR